MIAPQVNGRWVLAADTVVAAGRRILPKAETVEQAASCLRLLSGRRHRVISGISVVDPDGKQRSRRVETSVKFKRLDKTEIADYLACEEWRGKAGAYAIQGAAATFISRINGSYSNVVGLPLFETASLLRGLGFTWTANKAAAEK